MEIFLVILIDFKMIIDSIAAIGTLATVGTFIYVIKNQKGTQKQIDSLSKIASTFARQYQIERIQAGNTIYPKIKITLKHDERWGMKIVIKNLSYSIEIYRIIVHTNRHHSDITIKPKSNYIAIRQGETKSILPGEMVRHPLYLFSLSLRFFVVTPFDEAYEIRYAAGDTQEAYQSEAIPILYCKGEHEKRTVLTLDVKEYSMHGNMPGKIEDHFPDISENTDDDI